MLSGGGKPGSVCKPYQFSCSILGVFETGKHPLEASWGHCAGWRLNNPKRQIECSKSRTIDTSLTWTAQSVELLSLLGFEVLQV